MEGTPNAAAAISTRNPSASFPVGRSPELSNRPQTFKDFFQNPATAEAGMLSDFREAQARSRIQKVIGQKKGSQELNSPRQQINQSSEASEAAYQQSNESRGQKINSSLEGFAETFMDQMEPPTEAPGALAKAEGLARQQASAEQLKKQQQQDRIQKKTEMPESEGGEEDPTSKARDEIRKQAKAAIRRGVEEAAQGIGNALDLGTAGVSTVITIFMYAVTLTDLNAQMIWGYYIAKKKSFLFPALEWSPLPVGRVLPDVILHIGLVVLDLLIFSLVVIGFSLAIIIMFLPAAGWVVAYGLVTDPAMRAAVWMFIIQ